jgi:hypothetical protein
VTDFRFGFLAKANKNASLAFLLRFATIIEITSQAIRRREQGSRRLRQVWQRDKGGIAMPKFLELTLTTGGRRHVQVSDDDYIRDLYRWTKSRDDSWFSSVQGDMVNPAHVVAARLVDLPVHLDQFVEVRSMVL